MEIKIRYDCLHYIEFQLCVAVLQQCSELNANVSMQNLHTTQSKLCLFYA